MINLKQIKTVAVVGASNNQEKYGNKITKNLIARGFEVYPINLRETEIEGLKTFTKVSDLPIVPDLVDVVVPSSIGIEAIKEAIAFGVKNIWIQPGAESDEIIAFLKSQPQINYVANSCIMVN